MSINPYRHNPARQLGFSLIEMAIVLAILGLLLAGLVPSLSAQRESQRINETRKYMDEVREALMGYAISTANKRLPCPDTNGDGIAEATCSSAAQRVGTLPYKDLGVAGKDAFGSVLVYAVTKEFADSATHFTLSTTGTMHVCTTAACTANLTSNAAAVIVSRGANWANTPSTDEAENTDGDTDFVSHDFVQKGFDDLVIWISPNILFNRMVAAGQLP
jgi:prepilin-type N-terminal cleavage/methylation domain-containing protein